MGVAARRAFESQTPSSEFAPRAPRNVAASGLAQAPSVLLKLLARGGRAERSTAFSGPGAAIWSELCTEQARLNAAFPTCPLAGCCAAAGYWWRCTRRRRGRGCTPGGA